MQEQKEIKVKVNRKNITVTMGFWKVPQKSLYSDLGRGDSGGWRKIFKAFPVERPGMKNIIEDFKWRQAFQPTTQTQAVKRAIAKFLNVDSSSVRVIFDKHCGCNMCPCSPGWDIWINENVDFKPTCLDVSLSS